jgi:hypothetical protein
MCQLFHVTTRSFHNLLELFSNDESEDDFNNAMSYHSERECLMKKCDGDFTNITPKGMLPHLTPKQKGIVPRGEGRRS